MLHFQAKKVKLEASMFKCEIYATLKNSYTLQPTSAERNAEETEENAGEKAEKNAEEKKQNTLSSSQCAQKANRRLAELSGSPVSCHCGLLPRGKLSIQFCRESLSGTAR